MCLHFCILQAIKNWSRGRPGNEARDMCNQLFIYSQLYIEGGLQFAVNNFKMKLIKARIVVLRISKGTFQGAGRGDHKLTTPNFCPLSSMLASFPGPAQLFVACNTGRAWERG